MNSEDFIKSRTSIEMLGFLKGLYCASDILSDHLHARNADEGVSAETIVFMLEVMKLLQKKIETAVTTDSGGA